MTISKLINPKAIEVGKRAVELGLWTKVQAYNFTFVANEQDIKNMEWTLKNNFCLFCNNMLCYKWGVKHCYICGYEHNIKKRQL